MLHLHEEPELRMGQRREKSPAPGRIQNHNLSVMRRLLYPCATTTAPALLSLSNGGTFIISLNSYLIIDQYYKEQEIMGRRLVLYLH